MQNESGIGIECRQIQLATITASPAGHHRHRLSVSRRPTASARTGPTSRTASTASAECRRRTGSPKTISIPIPKRPTAPMRPAAVSSIRSIFDPSISASPPTISKRPIRRSSWDCGRSAEDASARRRLRRRPRIRPQSRQRHSRRHRHAGTGHPAGGAAGPSDLAAKRCEDAGVAKSSRRRSRATRSPIPTSAGKRIRSRACSAMSWPAGSPIGSISAAPTASSTPPAPVR